MDQETTVNKVLDEMSNRGLIMQMFYYIIRRYLLMVYAISYNEGRNRSGRRRAIAKLNIYGKTLDTYPSLKIAASSNKVDPSNISKSASGKNNYKVNGFFYKYLD